MSAIFKGALYLLAAYEWIEYGGILFLKVVSIIVGIKVCSLFSGIGGIDLAFLNSGFEIVWANEKDAAACKTYSYNFKNQITCSDIRQINAYTLPSFDVLVAGFPCQPFSIAGLQRGFNDPRGNLFFEIARIIDAKRPSVVFLENVDNLINHDNGRTFLVIYSSLAQFGYTVRYKVMSPIEYANIPQNRKRTFILAFKSLEDCNSFEFPEVVDLNHDISSIIDVHTKQNDIYYYDCKSEIYKKYANKIVDKSSVYKIKDNGIYKVKKHLCPTLVASMGTFQNRVPIICDDYGIRKLTLRECLDFQGFPHSFYFPKTITINDAYKQIGNSVCVPVVESLARQILKLYV